MVAWTAIYRDRYGTVNTTIRNDGHRLEMTIRGNEFSGVDFDLRTAEASLDAGASLLSVYLMHERYGKVRNRACWVGSCGASAF